MKPPNSVTLFETPISTHWFDENGIMCAISKKVERTVEHYEKVMDLYAGFATKERKICLLADTANSMPQNSKVRTFIAAEMPKYIEAHAVITTMPFDGTKINTFMRLSFSGFPIKIFSNEHDAKDWLKGFL